MKKQSVVKSVQASGTYDFNGKTYYRFDYEMEDGTLIQGSHLSQENHIPAGEPCEYEVKREHPTYGKSGSVSKIKEPYHGGHSGGGGDLTGIKVGHAINCACALLGNSEKFWESSPENRREAIKSFAHMIYSISDEMNQELKPSGQ